MAAGLPKTTDGEIHNTLLLRRAWAGEPIAARRSRSRKRWSSLVSCTLLMSLCSLAVSSQLYPAPSLNPLTVSLPLLANQLAYAHGTSIVCFGDSLTQGVGASPGHDYPSLLSKALGTSVINAGVDGDETADALKRLDTDVLAKDPRLVIVELGANDFLDNVPLNRAFANLDTIVQRIEAQGAVVVLVGPAPSPLSNALQKDYDRIIQKHPIAYIPNILDGIFTNRRFKSGDHLHPNDQGYALIAERIRRVIEPLLTSRKPSPPAP